MGGEGLPASRTVQDLLLTLLALLYAKLPHVYPFAQPFTFAITQFPHLVGTSHPMLHPCAFACGCNSRRHESPALQRSSMTRLGLRGVEQVRKLLLSALVVLIDTGSPLQVRAECAATGSILYSPLASVATA